MKLVLVVVVVIVATIIVISYLFPPATVDETSGTIGKVKKYNAGQISAKDVKLKNVMLSDEKSLNASITQLSDYKAFITDINKDLGNWTNKILSLTKNEKDIIKGADLLKKNSKVFDEFKSYIDQNMSTLDNTITLLSKISKKDTVNQNLEIEKTLNDYENFRIQIAERFLKMVDAIPNVHNALLLNKQPGIIGNKDNVMGIIILNKEGNLGVYSNKENVNFNKDMALGIYYNVQMGTSTVVPGNKEQLTNKVSGNKEQLQSKVLGTNASFGSQNLIGLFAFNNKDKSFAMAFGSSQLGSSSLNNLCPLGSLFNSSAPYGLAVMNSNEQLGMELMTP